ncbi:hypothetical protein CD932_25575 [Janthinobacterium sp. PC23-8]|nr:hypothetical protein CD932_25575 [Janthinobacterium sp. PC23-8]
MLLIKQLAGMRVGEVTERHALAICCRKMGLLRQVIESIITKIVLIAPFRQERHAFGYRICYARHYTAVFFHA